MRWISWVILMATPAVALANNGKAGETHAPTMTHLMMMLAIQSGVILFVAKIGNKLFERLNLPGVLGELMMGVLIGPYLLGGLALPGFPHGLFPVASATFPISPELYGICSVAAIVLLFMAGLETDIKLFVR